MILAFDLGTGGAKICIYDVNGYLLAKKFKSYPTTYRGTKYHIQNPEDWWDAVVSGTRELISENESYGKGIGTIAISGQSLSVIPINRKGKILFQDIPIWSDTRTGEQTERFFMNIDRDDWYSKTGNGFTPECYSLFKIMWYRDNYPDKFKDIDIILGSKDYINYKLTGSYATDYSYASGSGAYNLLKRSYIHEYFLAAEVSVKLLPEPIPSDELIGKLTKSAAEKLSINNSVKVYCGGVDNSCMAVGAGNIKEGRVYLSLGSSAWIAVSSQKPIIDTSISPFIFDHVVPDMYTSATSIFSAGSSLNWFRNTIAGKLELRAKAEDLDVFNLIMDEAEKSDIGSSGVIFNPTLAGSPASSTYGNIAGSFLNLNLNSTFNDLARSVLEGITFELYDKYKKLSRMSSLSDRMVIVGGGSKSLFWRQMFADVFGIPFSRINTDQDAAALGAAAIAAVGSGLWSSYAEIDNVVQELETLTPVQKNFEIYSDLFDNYTKTWKQLSNIGSIINN